MPSHMLRKEAPNLDGKEGEERSYTTREPAREVRDFLSDSSVWQRFQEQVGFRKGDIVIVTYFKVGTTLTQNIVYQILHNGKFPSADLAKASPWLDSSFGDHGGMLADLKSQRGQAGNQIAYACGHGPHRSPGALYLRG
jgi:hypothetical protein